MKGTLAVSMLAAALVAGCAGTPPTEKRVATNATGSTAAKVQCVQETGSRIQHKPGECIGPGRSYSRDDLDSTGAFTPAEALKKLDPAL